MSVLLERVSTRTSNPYGQTAVERAEIAARLDAVEPILRASCTLELDGRTDPEQLVDIIESLLRSIVPPDPGVGDPR